MYNFIKLSWQDDTWQRGVVFEAPAMGQETELFINAAERQH
jgi:hypothetical protein